MEGGTGQDTAGETERVAGLGEAGKEKGNVGEGSGACPDDLLGEQDQLHEQSVVSAHLQGVPGEAEDSHLQRPLGAWVVGQLQGRHHRPELVAGVVQHHGKLAGS